MLRRLTSKCLSRAVQFDAFDVLTPLQVGVGVKAGCEAVVHSVAHILDRGDLPVLSRWIILIDFSIAFNSVSREHMFREVLALLPGLSSWVECCYNTESHLIFGDHSLLSHCGVQQGDRSPWPPVLCTHSSTNRRENQQGSFQSPLQRLVPRWHPTGPRCSSEDHRGRRSPQGFAPKSLQVSTLHPPGGSSRQ